MPYAGSPIAEYLSKQIDIAQGMGKSQREIAAELGYEKSNMISMMKTGAVKVPLDKIPALAKALNVDAAFLFRLAMQQYWPEVGEVIAQLFGSPLSANEREIVDYVRKITKEGDPALTAAAKACLREAFSK